MMEYNCEFCGRINKTNNDTFKCKCCSRINIVPEVEKEEIFNFNVDYSEE